MVIPTRARRQTRTRDLLPLAHALGTGCTASATRVESPASRRAGGGGDAVLQCLRCTLAHGVRKLLRQRLLQRLPPPLLRGVRSSARRQASARTRRCPIALGFPGPSAARESEACDDDEIRRRLHWENLAHGGHAEKEPAGSRRRTALQRRGPRTPTDGTTDDAVRQAFFFAGVEIG